MGSRSKRSKMRSKERKKRKLTNPNPIKTLTFFHKTIKLPHLRHRSLSPPFFPKYIFNLFPKWSSIFFMFRRKVI